MAFLAPFIAPAVEAVAGTAAVGAGEAAAGAAVGGAVAGGEVAVGGGMLARAGSLLKSPLGRMGVGSMMRGQGNQQQAQQMRNPAGENQERLTQALQPHQFG